MKSRQIFIAAIVTLFAMASSAQTRVIVKGPGTRQLAEYTNEVNPDEEYVYLSKGYLIVGSGADQRGFECFTSNATGQNYAEMVNTYKQAFGDSVNVYCMMIPTNGEFYSPVEAVEKGYIKSERPTIERLYSQLLDQVIAVDCYTPLSKHVTENICSHTDHHWLPRGAFYAAQAFAKAAQVPFRDLSSYEEHVTHDFVGTMPRFSGYQKLRDAAEDFVYYTPKGVEYTTNQVVYTLDKSRRNVVSEEEQDSVKFFRHYKDGSGSAYLTFFGGDYNITHVTTSTKNGRRLMLVKDSFGNAIPGYLFYSFEEIFVVDSRYFTPNMREFVTGNKVTDILFCNNIVHACTPSISKGLLKYLDQ
ncbi:MAG: hypothetical protein IKW85_09880 [Muribaculaceae bacterium]|nr:hypothetical protein [Muribaculaceae bacterium]